MTPLVRMLVLMAALLCAGLALLAPAPAEAASRGQCASWTAKRCHFWTAKVTFVADGDTIEVDLDGDNSKATRRVRFTGINAMEMTAYSSTRSKRRGDCHAVAATNRLEDLIRRGRWRVRLAAQDPASRSNSRLRRQVSARIGGRWVDLNAKLAAEGHTLWLPNGVENAWNTRYNRLVQKAAARQLRLWNPIGCGAGPQNDHLIRMWVNWDAEGVDNRNLNSEWIKIRNDGPTALNLGGWLVRDSFHRQLRFRAGTSVAPNRSLWIHSGCGTASAEHRYWCSSGSLFENVSYDGRGLGDGAYLFDPRGNLRESFVFPCLVNCADQMAGTVELSVNPRRAETVTLTNRGQGMADLEGYVLKQIYGGGYSHIYPFEHDSRLAPGERMTVRVQSSGSDTRLTKVWSFNQYIMPDSGGATELRNLNDTLITCYEWGSGSC